MENNMKIIAIAGGFGSGKTTYALNKLYTNLQMGILTTITNFSLYIKNFFSVNFGLTKFGVIPQQRFLTITDEDIKTAILYSFRNLLTKEKINNLNLFDLKDRMNDCLNNINYSYNFRKCLTIFGTDIMRNQYDDKIWMNLTLSKINSEILNSSDYNKVIIIDDLRFMVEFKMLNNMYKNDIEFLYIEQPNDEELLQRLKLKDINELNELRKNISEQEIEQIKPYCKIVMNNEPKLLLI